VSEEDHNALERRLRDLFTRVDPVPAEATEFARAALGWRRLDADLAELLADSALPTGAATTRGDETERSLTFAAADLTIDLEARRAGDVYTVLGQIAPAPASATVEAQGGDGTRLALVESDALGRFRLTLASGGRVRLLVERPGATTVDTSWFSL